MSNLNLEAIKRYNEKLKEYNDKASKIQAEIDFNNREIESSCEELSKVLGLEVTKDNLIQVYNDRIEKIRSTLESGEAILRRVTEQEAEIIREGGII